MGKKKRASNEIRDVKISPWPVKYPAGSALIEMGDTKVLCCANILDEVPPFLIGQGTGWVTAEYSMLPASTGTRNRRERGGKISGRTQEIQRLIGRSLRSVVDMTKLGERTIIIDCDVLQADGGTRTASITGAFVAMTLAVEKLLSDGSIEENPITDYVAAVSIGIIGGKIHIDLDYELDSNADVDMNLVMTKKGEIVEIQATAEKESFSKETLSKLILNAERGIKKLFKIQADAIKCGLKKIR
ncbi:MAG: ribonuclease PH [Candidatus Schekmanbacteria bacterium]|nr:MAG: ribonuclease PH [Candidatus Schekmanbacteria bacterium]